MAYGPLERAESDIDHLLRKDPNFAAIDEKAGLMQEGGCEYFERNIENNSRQQRARYWLGYFHSRLPRARHRGKDLPPRPDPGPAGARQEFAGKEADLFCNRACVRAKPGQAAPA